MICNGGLKNIIELFLESNRYKDKNIILSPIPINDSWLDKLLSEISPDYLNTMNNDVKNKM